jgi:hypothetical protein
MVGKFVWTLLLKAVVVVVAILAVLEAAATMDVALSAAGRTAADLAEAEAEAEAAADVEVIMEAAVVVATEEGETTVDTQPHATIVVTEVADMTGGATNTEPAVIYPPAAVLIF